MLESNLNVSSSFEGLNWQNFGIRSFPRREPDADAPLLPPDNSERLEKAHQSLHLDKGKKSIAQQYAAPFLKVVALLQDAVNGYPDYDGFAKLNEALTRLPSYRSFLEREVARGDPRFNAVQAAHCADILFRHAPPGDADKLEESCQAIRALRFVPPHDPQAEQNFGALGDLFVEVHICLETIRGCRTWKRGREHALTDELQDDITAALKHITAAHR